MEIFKLHTLMAVRSARPLQTLIGWTDSADLRMHGPVTAKSPHYHLYAHYYIYIWSRNAWEACRNCDVSANENKVSNEIFVLTHTLFEGTLKLLVNFGDSLFFRALY
jgi:hypothetical protein